MSDSAIKVWCDTCNGRGWDGEEACRTCGGNGFTSAGGGKARPRIVSENIYTRELLLRSFHAAAHAGVGGAMVLNGASAAGLLLALHGEPRAAFNAIVNAMPISGPFMQAMRILDRLVEIERADTEHPRAVGVGR